MAKTIFILRGLPGSGKSTVAQGNQAFSTDDYFMVGGVYVFDPEQLGPAHRWNKWRVSKACERGWDRIFVDNTNTTWKEFKDYLDLALEHGYDVVFRTPLTSWAFDVEACFLKNSHRVPKSVIEKMYDRFMSNEEITKLMKEHYPNVIFTFVGAEKLND